MPFGLLKPQHPSPGNSEAQILVSGPFPLGRPILTLRPAITTLPSHSLYLVHPSAGASGAQTTAAGRLDSYAVMETAIPCGPVKQTSLALLIKLHYKFQNSVL